MFPVVGKSVPCSSARAPFLMPWGTELAGVITLLVLSEDATILSGKKLSKGECSVFAQCRNMWRQVKKLEAIHIIFMDVTVPSHNVHAQAGKKLR